MKQFARMIALLMLAFWTHTALAETIALPKRSGPVPLTSKGVPHVQIGVKTEPTLIAELLKKVAKIPGVRVQNTVISLPGALGFWLDESIALARPDVIVGGREFAHVHPDGSLHASLAPKLAAEAVKNGWATYHPWAKQRPGWDGFVMIYSAQTKEELVVVHRLILGSYNFITGRSVSSVD